MTNLTKIILFISFTLLVCNSCKDTAKGSEGIQLTSANADVPALLDRSEKTQLGKEWEAVQSSYQKNNLALAKNPADNNARLSLSQLYVKEARVTGEHGHYYPAALKVLNKVLEQKEVDADTKFLALMNKAGVQLSLHEFQDALTTGLEAVQLNPNNAQIHGVLVDCYVELGHYEKAVKLADRMINLKPDLRSYSRVSYLREIHGDTDGAYKAMKLAAEAGYPGTEETAWTMLTLGEMYSLYGEPKNARSVFTQILEMRPDYPFALGAIADLDIAAGNYEKAEKDLHTAIDIIPEVGFYVSLAEIYKEENRQEELKDITQEIFVMLQDDVDHGHNMNLEYANIHLNLLDDPTSALSYIEKEYEKRPNNIDVNRLMAEVHYALEKTELSKAYAVAASSTDSNHPQLIELNSLLN